MTPGQIVITNPEPIELNAGRQTIKLRVSNQGDRPIQVGSHFHFYEVNTGLEFDREKAKGMHLNITAGTAIRFEPGDEKEIELVPFGGMRKIYGFNGLVNGRLN
jgi:urease subunit beta